MQTPQIIPSGKGCGAEVRGVDLAALDSLTVSTLQQAILENLVVFVRGQSISDPQLIALGKTFGALEAPGMSVIGKPYIDAYPDILVISNLMADGQPMGNLGAGEAIWHTDMSYRVRPCTIAILHALEAPPTGGNTYFANQYMAYDTLPDKLKKKLDGKLLIHDETYNSGGQLRKGFEPVTDPREAPGAQHRIFRTLPLSKRKALYLGRRRNAYIIGLSLEESEALLDQLWEHAARPEFVWGHEWQPGDTLIWDNRCLNHRRDSFDPNERRMMHRVQISGERPL